MYCGITPSCLFLIAIADCGPPPPNDPPPTEPAMLNALSRRCNFPSTFASVAFVADSRAVERNANVAPTLIDRRIPITVTTIRSSSSVNADRRRSTRGGVRSAVRRAAGMAAGGRGRAGGGDGGRVIRRPACRGRSS